MRETFMSLPVKTGARSSTPSASCQNAKYCKIGSSYIISHVV